jgi:hypothetical protein
MNTPRNKESDLARVTIVADLAAADVGLVAFAVIKVATFRAVRVSAIIFRILNIGYEKCFFFLISL